MKKGSFKKRLAAFALLPLILAACGGTQVSLTSETENSEFGVNYSQAKALEKMETGVFDTLSQENCAKENSSYTWEVAQLIGAMNVLGQYDTAVLMDGPPRKDGTIAIYLCDMPGSKAYTLHKSVFLSNDFLGELHDKAANDGTDNLFMPAIGFVLFHEIGHAALNHSASRMDKSGGVTGYNGFDLMQETEAGQFAYGLMADLGLSHEGAELAVSIQ